VILKPININIEDYPAEFHTVLSNAKFYDSSCSPEAKVIFIDKEQGFFLKSAPKGSLEREYIMTRYFHSKGLAAYALDYISVEQDWMLTEKIHGDDCTATKYLEQPEKLCDTFAERLALLHSMDFADCPVQNHTTQFLDKAKRNRENGVYDESLFPDNWGYPSAEKAWEIVINHGHLLQSDTLLHGDYCLPNIILNDWKFSGFIDFDNGGVGDRHIDVFWGAWTLTFNLKTDKYRERFIDAYGRDKVDEEILRVIAAAEVFG